MFDPMKEDLRGRRFSSDEEISGVMQNWLKTKTKQLLSPITFLLTLLKAHFFTCVTEVT
jgi:hypothetical protein